MEELYAWRSLCSRTGLPSRGNIPIFVLKTRRWIRTATVLAFLALVNACSPEEAPELRASLESGTAECMTGDWDGMAASSLPPPEWLSPQGVQLASDGSRLVVRFIVDERLLAPGPGHSTVLRVQGYTGKSGKGRDWFDFNWSSGGAQKATANLVRHRETEGPEEWNDYPLRSEVTSEWVALEAAADQLTDLGSRFPWRADLTLASLDPASMSVWKASCPESESDTLDFPQDRPPRLASPSPIEDASSGEAPGGREGNVIGMKGSGSSSREANAGEIEGNGIRIDEVRNSIASALAPVLGHRPDVDCDRANEVSPIEVAVGQSFTCLFDDGPHSVGVVEVEVLPGGSWEWMVEGVEGD